MSLFFGHQLQGYGGEDGPMKAMHDAIADAQRRFNAAVESKLRADLWRLRTHRMNVVRVTKGRGLVQVGMGTEWALSEATWLERLLPPGPRPLP